MRWVLVFGAMGLLLALAGCDTWARADAAQAARYRMVGLTKEQVLICMGPPKQKAHVGETEVWSYASTNGLSRSSSSSQKYSGITFGNGEKSKSFCSVNVVMTDGVVSVVHYNGPRGTVFAHDEQCGFAIEHCVD